MTKVSIGFFLGSKKKIKKENGERTFAYSVGLHFRIGNDKQLTRLTGPYVPTSTIYERAKRKTLKEHDTIETVKDNELKLIKFKMVTAQNRLNEAVKLVPEYRLSYDTISAIIDEAKKIDELIFSEPEMPFNAVGIVAQATGIPAEMLNPVLPPVVEQEAKKSTQSSQAQEQNWQMVSVSSGQLSVRAKKPTDTDAESDEATWIMNAAIAATRAVSAIDQMVANDPSHPLFLSSEAKRMKQWNTLQNRDSKSIIDKHGNLIYCEFEPRANFLDWFIKTRPAKNGPKSKKAYGIVVKAIIRYFEKRRELELAAGAKPSLLNINGQHWLPFTALQHEKVFWDMQAWLQKEGCFIKEKKPKKDKKTGETQQVEETQQEEEAQQVEETQQEEEAQQEEEIQQEEEAQQSKGKPMKVTTIKTYMGYIQASFKKAVKAGLILESMNPHGRHGYVLPIPDKVDRSLTTEQLRAIWEYVPKKGGRKVKYTEKIALDYFFMSYFSNGMNFCDIARLRWYQVYFGKDEAELKGKEEGNSKGKEKKNPKGKDERYFKFVRSKIKSKRNTFESVRVDITPEVEPYMAKYCNKEYHPENYVFPIIKPKRGPRGEYLPLLTGEESIAERDAIIIEEYRQIQNFIVGVNRVLKRIAMEVLGEELDLTTYFARHTLVNELEAIGATVKAIQKRLGQNSQASYDYYNNRRDYKQDCENSRALANRLYEKAAEKPTKAAA